MNPPPEPPSQCASSADAALTDPPSEHESLRRLLVGDNYAYYAKSWRRVEQEKRQSFWNWAAFFLGLGWMAYRKMYFYSCIFVAVVLVEISCEYVFGLSGGWSWLIDLGNAVAFGWQGNRWYKMHVDRRLRELVPNDESSEAVRQQLAREGGTSPGAGIGFVALLVTGGILYEVVMGLLHSH